MQCAICKKEIMQSSYSNAILCSSGDCFTQNYWNELVEHKDDPCSVRINGCHYFINTEDDNHVFRGFDGRLFAIKFFNGRIVKTTNLWCQGDIPEPYKEFLCDNSEFVSPFGTESKQELPCADK